MAPKKLGVAKVSTTIERQVCLNGISVLETPQAIGKATASEKIEVAKASFKVVQKAVYNSGSE